jgi:hypothetical protein
MAGRREVEFMVGVAVDGDKELEAGLSPKVVEALGGLRRRDP